MGKQKLVQSALSGVDIRRPETITPLLKVDPEHGIALLGASTAMLKSERDIAAREAATHYLTARFAPKPDGAPGATPTMAPGAVSQDANNAWLALAQHDPQQAIQLRESVDKMDETQRKRLLESQDALHETAIATRQLPYEQRRAYIAQQAPYLAQHFVTPEQIAGFDPTDQNLDIATTQALGVKGAIEQARQARQDAETQRHNRVTEGTAAGHLALDQKKEQRLTQWGPQSIIMGGAVPNNTDDLDY